VVGEDTVYAYIYTYIQYEYGELTLEKAYGVASVSRIDKITGLFCRILSLFIGLFCKRDL